jgi:hypothetical protein
MAATIPEHSAKRKPHFCFLWAAAPAADPWRFAPVVWHNTTMAFRGKNSKKNNLDRGVDTLGRVNYFSRRKAQQLMTQEEARPLSGAVAELASVVASIDEESAVAELARAEQVRGRVEGRLNYLIERSTIASAQVARKAGGLFRLPVEVEMDPSSFTVEMDYDVEDHESVYGRHQFKGGVELGASDDKITLDVLYDAYAYEHNGVPFNTEMAFFYRGKHVRDARELLAAVENDS